MGKKVDEFKKRVELQSVSVAVDAMADVFRFYEKGVLKPNYCYENYVNHALVVVGYTSGPKSTKCKIN